MNASRQLDTTDRQLIVALQAGSDLEFCPPEVDR
jgi:hypothetical protein